ncbi:MATE family efflux transporter [Anaerobacillus alkalilacustris]|uniref:Probable multidrug resistance protein NorM n=1 Tax=Anaerobacillus alkalilacustris TaxID=393763 RepID=A0A1S2LJW0_9BACI|nr:MATE family efflux transporter [Anaerobacillus alkalilacustris]OIJ12480.1 MATE family efflux transporter [Anaerobacillus alkalilacustris]
MHKETLSSTTNFTWKQYLALVVPITLAAVTTPLLGAVDTAVVGRMPDPSYIGGVAIGTLIFNTIYWLLGFLKVGTSGFTAQASGNQNQQELISAFIRPAFLAICFGVLFILLQIPIEKAAFLLIESTPLVERMASDYFSIRIWGAPFALLNYCILGWLIGSSRVKVSLTLQLYMNISNIILSILLVLVFQFGVKGVAFATLFSEVSTVIIGLVLLKRLNVFSLSYLKSGAFFDKAKFMTMLKMNRDLFIRTVCLLTVFGFFTARGSAMGVEILAANAILFQIHYLIAYMYDGLAGANSILTGKAIGQQNYLLFKQTKKMSFVWGIALSTSMFLLLLIFRDPLLFLFTSLDSLKELTVNYYFWILLYPFVTFWGLLLYGMFTGATEGVPIRNSTILALLLFFLVFTVSFPSMQNHGLWLSFLSFSLGRTLFLGAYTSRLHAKLKRVCEAA